MYHTRNKAIKQARMIMAIGKAAGENPSLHGHFTKTKDVI
jgi:hypothetical protein